MLTQPMTFEEKRKLSMAVHNLPHSKLGRVIEILDRRLQRGPAGGAAAAAPPRPVSTIDVDLETLDVRTMRELELYVRSVAQRKKSKVRKRVPPRVAEDPASGTASETLSGDSSDHYQNTRYQYHSSSADSPGP
eukprot:TRINITY_DN10183_c0_g1_i6.p2 TRINITY_DN10183_c0_g1~~TRINITY_DN10183_c0_g1_i6.p2  ORF type:complete len:134 (+),score=34.92 TRINITY_DN10183_c0_g1_i6:166-567(+)